MGKVFGNDDESLELSCYIIPNFNNIIRQLGSQSIMTETIPITQKFDILRETTERLPLKCKLFLQLLLSQLPQGNKIQIPKDFKKAYSFFTQTFSKLKSQEKLYYIGELSDHITLCLASSKIPASHLVDQIETSCEMKASFAGLSLWEKRMFKYSYRLSRIQLCGAKKEDMLDLKNYLIRQSGSQKDAMVLESISKVVPEKLSKVTLRFKNSSIFHEIYNHLRKDVIQLSQQKIEELIKEDLKQNSAQNTKESGNGCKGFTILTTRVMTDYFKDKDSFGQKLKKSRFNSQLLYHKNNVHIYRSSDHKRCFYLEQTIIKPATLASIKEQVNILTSESNGTIVKEVLEIFTQHITANYYKLDVGRKEYQFVFITQRNEKEDGLQVIMKTATNFFLDISIQFIAVSLKKITDSHYYLKISTILDCPKKKSNMQEEIINLLLSLAVSDDPHIRKPSIKHIPCLNDQANYSVLQIDDKCKESYLANQSMHCNVENHDEVNTVSSGKKQSSQESSGEQKEEYFFSIMGDEEDQDLEFFDCQEFSKKVIEKIDLDSNLQTQVTTMQDANYLKIKSFSQPLPACEFKLLTEHYLFGEWRRSSKGGVVCANEAVIKEQKRIVKLVMTRIGNNIFKGNSIMNVSLPVQLFRDQSSLVSIGRNISYAPLLIEPIANKDPIQRMKNIAVFEISMTALALSTRKPFNPILGETYQGQIAGCPLFLQQISHHPPVTSIYFIGRGYKIYGTMRVQINLRLNYVKGVNDALMTIQFDSGEKVQFGLPVMLINGLIIGERSIYYQGTVFITDETNLLITELTYNACNSKKGIFSFKSQSPDLLSGDIYKVSPSFMQKFINSKRTLSPKKDEGNRIVSRIQGEWNGQILIDNEKVFDFERQLPVQLENHHCPLPSDSVFRPDVIELSKGNMNTSQDEKDRLQELQRRDKKLRLSFKVPKGGR